MFCVHVPFRQPCLELGREWRRYIHISKEEGHEWWPRLPKRLLPGRMFRKGPKSEGKKREEELKYQLVNLRLGVFQLAQEYCDRLVCASHNVRAPSHEHSDEVDPDNISSGLIREV
jgi:hypothetical protein